MDLGKMIINDAITDSEKGFPYKELLNLDYFKIIEMPIMTC